jgi:exodeoxyribonuclease V beta subunit
MTAGPAVGSDSAGPAGPAGGPVDPTPFDISDGIPDGTTLLEASAGTGKTHTIASLAVRLLAEGMPVERLLVVTFTRSATGELRSRVRARLVAAEAGLRAALAGVPPGGDELVALLSTGPAELVRRRHLALADARADFDSATITTIHGFCDQVLRSLGTAADFGRDLRFVDSLDEMIDEVVDDLYVRKFVGASAPQFDRATARRIVATAVANRDAAIEPSLAPPDTLEGMRASLARRGREELLRRARLAGTISFDDQLDRLHATLTGSSPAVALERLRHRFAAVLVDEFQDTDPIQWEIFREAFAGRASPLVLIGDPKQAIYSFRGADVWAYLSAAASADHHFTLQTNWRSDQPLIDAVDAILAGATLGHPDIRYRTVTAAPGRQASRLAGSPAGAPLRLRLVHRDDGVIDLTARGWASTASARTVVAADLAADIASFLASGAQVIGDGGADPVQPGDLAVLVRTNHEAAIVHAALAAAGIPSVVAGAGSVFATEAAAHWLSLLEALEQPSSATRASRAALTPFVGWDIPRLVAAGGAPGDAGAGAAADAHPGSRLEDVQASLYRWSGVLSERGVAALYETVAAETDLIARELAWAGGERRLTDLRHIAELLHSEALESGARARRLTSWLRDRSSESGTDTAPEDRSRRLESDADAVQIQTIHRSKGLEFPIVYLPYMWTAFPDTDLLPLYHDTDNGDRRTVDVGGDRWEGFGRHKSRAYDERRGEDLRQAYVALTRARHQVVVWWVTSSETKSSSLARLVLGPGRASPLLAPPAQMPANDDLIEKKLVEVARRAPGRVSVERVVRPGPVAWGESPRAEPHLEVCQFDRVLDDSWRRTSYTAITAGIHRAAPGPVVTSEAESPGLDDEPDLGAVPAAFEPEDLGLPGVGADVPSRTPVAEEEARRLVSMWSELPSGPAFGTAVHAVLETVDFSAADLGGALLEAVNQSGVWGLGPDQDGASRLVQALAAAVETPLGPLAGGRRLRDVPRQDRLDELRFELPLAGGDSPSGRLSPDDIATCLSRWLRPGDPLSGYPDRLHDPALARSLRGYLTGSIDLVLRIPAEHGTRHLIVDYKTNWLGPPGAELTAWHYRPASLAPAMAAEHYPLQALLYLVALHRYLRWRLAGYDPERHLGGVLYLFLRGMSGGASPVFDGSSCGVFAWDPPAGLTVELSDLLDAGGAT